MNMWEIFKLALAHPKKLFKQVGKAKQPQLGFAFGYFTVLSLLRALLGGLVGAALMAALTPLLSQWGSGVYGMLGLSAGGSYVLNTVIGFVVGLAFSFVWAGLLHLWILLFGGKAGYAKTYELGAYAGTPALLLGWIPGLSWVGSIWSLVLLIIGTQEVHGIAKQRAILMYVIPVAVLFVLAIVLFVVVISLFLASGVAALGGTL